MRSRISIRNNLLITTAVIVTVFLALFMSKQDGESGDSRLSVIVETSVAVGGTRLAVLLPTTTSVAEPTMTETVEPTATIGVEGEGTAVLAVVLHSDCPNTPAEWLPHTVLEGESIHTLSILSGATVNSIMQANCLPMTYGITGLEIYLPPQPPPPVVCGPPSWWQPQLIYAGDTLYSLSLRYGTTVYSIMQANCLSSSYLVAGRTLYLPQVVATVTSTPTQTPLPTPIPPTSVPPTAVPPPTNTPVPPTSTPVPPTNTPVPPTNTPIPPTNTAIPPTATPITPTVPPTDVPTATPITPTVPPTDVPTATPITPTVPPTDVPTATPITPTVPPTAIPTATPITPTPTL